MPSGSRCTAAASHAASTRSAGGSVTGTPISRRGTPRLETAPKATRADPAPAGCCHAAEGAQMPVQLNHTIVAARDRWESARFLADLLGRPAPTAYGPFAVVELDNDVSLDYMEE